MDIKPNHFQLMEGIVNMFTNEIMYDLSRKEII